jgi:hypothetical protein
MAYSVVQLYFGLAVVAAVVLIYYVYRYYRHNHCAGDPDCPSGQVCLAGRRCGALPINGACNTGTDCMLGQMCVNNKCVPLA